MKKIALALALLFIAVSAQAQTWDCFGGLLTYANGAPGPVGTNAPHPQSGTFSRLGSTVTATVTNGAAYAIGEPMFVSGTGTALDWSNASCNKANSQAGGLLITNIVGNTLTLTSPSSGTISAHSGTIRPVRWYVQVVTTGSGTGPQLITPNNTWLFSEQVAQANADPIAKYGSNGCNTAKDEFIAWNSLGGAAGSGFNGTGHANLNDDYYDDGSCPSNNRIPQLLEQMLTSYFSNGGASTYNNINQTAKDMDLAVDANYACQGISRPSLDFLDAKWEAFAQGYLTNTNFTTFAQSAWLMGVDVQDTGVGGAGPTNSTWEFNTVPVGRNDCHQGLVVLATSPHQTVSANVLYSGTNAPYLYIDPKVYMKDGAAVNFYGESVTGTAPNPCNALIPGSICSMQDFLCGSAGSLYATIGALNTAWGTSYTTCGTSESPFTAEAVGTGTGAQTVFSHTLAHTNVTPTSVQILVGGTAKAGDCPNFETSCTASAGQGQILSHDNTVASGTVTYSTGALTITFTTAPANGVAITANYTTGGWDAGGTGLLDEDGTHLGTNGVCPLEPASFINNHSYNVGDEIDDGSRSWQYVTTAGSSQNVGSPTFSATTGNTTLSGTVLFTSLGAPVCGTGGTYTGTLPNSQMGADMNAFVEHVSGAFMSGARTAIKTVAPDLLYWGPDQLGVWQSTSNKYVLMAANTYADMAMVELWDGSQDGAGPSKFDYMTHYYSGPVSDYLSPVSSQSAFTCNGNVPCFPTQQAKGQWWYTISTYWLTHKGHDGQIHGAATQWVSNIDGEQSSSFGFETAKYNPYNTHDNVVPVVSCLFNAFSCGGEASASWNGTDSITHAGCGLCIADANALWFTLAPSAFTPPAPAPQFLLSLVNKETQTHEDVPVLLGAKEKR